MWQCWILLWLALGVAANPYETQLVSWAVEARPADAFRFGCALAAAPSIVHMDQWQSALRSYQRHQEPGSVPAYMWQQHSTENGLDVDEPRQSACDYWTRLLCHYSQPVEHEPEQPPPPVPLTNTSFVAPVRCSLLSETGEQCVGGDRMESEPYSQLPCSGHFRLCRTRTQFTRQTVVRCTCSHEFRILYGK